MKKTALALTIGILALGLLAAVWGGSRFPTPVTSLPATCSTGQYFHLLTTNQLYFCYAPNSTVGLIPTPDTFNTVTVSTSLTIPAADLSAGCSTEGQFAFDTGGATLELCVCHSSAWACATVTTGGPVD